MNLVRILSVTPQDWSSVMLRAVQVAGLCLAVFVTGEFNASAAPVNNGGFETGTFPAWEPITAAAGDGTSAGLSVSGGLTTSGSPIGPPQGSFQAFLRNGTGAQGVPPANSSTVAAIETFLSLATGTISGLLPGTALGGGVALRQTITVQAGDVLSFLWNYLTNEATGTSGLNDFAFWSLGIDNGTDADVTFLAAGLANSLSGSPVRTAVTGAAFTSQTGFLSVTTALDLFDTPGTYVLGFGLLHGTTGTELVSLQESGLLVDVVQQTSRTPPSEVPEPASMALFAIGSCCFGIGAARRRRQQQLAA